jgi:hypothetical protein
VGKRSEWAVSVIMEWRSRHDVGMRARVEYEGYVGSTRGLRRAT